MTDTSTINSLGGYPLGAANDPRVLWKPCPGFEDKYLVSNIGVIKSVGTYNTCKKGFLTPMCDTSGYLHVRLYDGTKSKDFSVHRLVALAFIANPKNLTHVNHINKNKQDNRVENLEWCSNQYNVTYSLGKRIKQFTKEGIFIKEYMSLSEVGRLLNIPTSNISKCCMGKRKSAGGFIWKYENYE